jgi:hypothetical protein
LSLQAARPASVMPLISRRRLSSRTIAVGHPESTWSPMVPFAIGLGGTCRYRRADVQPASSASSSRSGGARPARSRPALRSRSPQEPAAQRIASSSLS